MINKFELIGIFASIAVMALALFLLCIESTAVANLEVTGNDQAAVAVVAENNTQEQLYNTLANSVNLDGDLEKLIIDDVTIGSGESVVGDDRVTVNYIGTLTNGQEFDNSYNNGRPFSFTQGDGKVIAGWEEGILGMKVGGKRILVIPPEMGYGNRAVGPIPANSTLIFAIELLAINE